MRTESGAISVGAPFSRARMRIEIEHALGVSEFQPEVLFLTEEGRIVLDQLLSSIGCDSRVAMMKENQATTIQVLKDSRALESLSFLAGMRKGLQIN